MIGFGERQRGAIIDRRQAAPQQHLALEIQLLRALITAIDPAFGHQPLEFAFIQVKPGGLAFLAIGDEAKPGQIGAIALDIFLTAARCIGIVDAQQKAPACLLASNQLCSAVRTFANVQRACGEGAKRVVTVMAGSITPCGTRG